MQKSLELIKCLKLIYQTPEEKEKKKVKMFLELIVHLTLFMVCINNTSKFVYPKMRRRMFPFK